MELVLGFIKADLDKSLLALAIIGLVSGSLAVSLFRGSKRALRNLRETVRDLKAHTPDLDHYQPAIYSVSFGKFYFGAAAGLYSLSMGVFFLGAFGVSWVNIDISKGAGLYLLGGGTALLIYGYRLFLKDHQRITPVYNHLAAKIPFELLALKKAAEGKHKLSGLIDSVEDSLRKDVDSK